MGSSRSRKMARAIALAILVVAGIFIASQSLTRISFPR